MENALPPGSLILAGRYCLTRLLYQRPRVNLYLGQRLGTALACEARGREGALLVAVRELVLDEIPSEAQTQITRAAREEFHLPGVVSSLRLPGTGERMWLSSERERHYLILQLHSEHETASPSTIATLADLLQEPRWPRWLDTQTALTWGIQLCRIVARLHRLGTLLGDLDPATVLIDRRGLAVWLPLLLVSWPPSPHFWRAVGEGGRRAEASSAPTNRANAARHFSPVFPTFESAFAAPELVERACDERADVYALGAVLYLLLTGYAPASALRRLASNLNLHGTSHNSCELELIPPRLLASHMPPMLEDTLLRCLALDPAERYPTVFSLIETLEAVQEAGYVPRKTTRWPLFTKKL